MGVFHSCLPKKNRVGVAESEEHVLTDEMMEAKGGMSFNVTFGTAEMPKLPPIRVANGQKEGDFEKWRATQEKFQAQKQQRAKDNREKEKIQKQIETAQKEMERLEKYVNLKDEE